MKTFVLLFIFICAVCFSAYAHEDKNTDGLNIGDGMEIRKIKGHNLLIPKDANVRKEGGVLKVESGTEYAVKRFIKTEKHLEEIDATLANLQNQMDELRKMIEAIKEAK